MTKTWKLKITKAGIVILIGVLFTMIGVLHSFAEEVPELPFELWQAIVAGDPSVMVRCDWDRVGGLPFIRRAMEADQPSDLRKLPLIGSTLRAAIVATPVLGEIHETWSGMKDIEGGRGDGAWLLTELEPEQIRVRLRAEGWIEIPGALDLFAEPLDSGDDEYYEYLLEKNKDQPDFDPSTALIEVTQGKWKILIGSSGWVYASPPGGVPKGACCLYSPDLESMEKQNYRFPFDQLLADDDSFLCRMAVDMPKNEVKEEPEPDSDGSVSEQDRLEAEIQQLRDLQDMVVLAQVGDLFFVTTEVDGGIAIDLEARTPAGNGGSHTVDVLEGGLIIMRLVTMWAGPGLADELDFAVFRDLGDHVVGSVVLSQASIYEAVDGYLDHEERVDELWERIRVLEKQKLLENEER